MSYQVQLPKFEGPLALLLYLIRKEEMDVFDINILEITRQYLDYIRLMKELDLEVAGEFVAMAATLLHIKSRMLLPQYNEEGDVVETEDPRKELVQKLLEYQRFQDAGKQLYERPLLRRDVWNRGSPEDFDGQLVGDIILEEDGLFSLISSYRRAIKNMKRAVHQVRSKALSISMRIMQIRDRFVVGQRVRMQDLLSEGPGFRVQVLITFLSLLELARMGFVSVFQNETYGDIHVETLRAIDRNVLERVQEFDSANAEAVATKIMNEAADLMADSENSSVSGEPIALAAPEAQQMDLLEMQSIADAPTAGTSIETAVDADGNPMESLHPSQVATDEEIFAAELALGEAIDDGANEIAEESIFEDSKSNKDIEAEV